LSLLFGKRGSGLFAGKSPQLQGVVFPVQENIRKARLKVGFAGCEA